MRIRAPAVVHIRRAHIILILAGLVPTIFMTALGIILLAAESGGLVVVVGAAALAFCTSAVTGYILVSIFLSKGASIARFQNDYLSSVSHEINTPLTSIRMFIDTLRSEDRLDAEEKRKCLDLLQQEMERLDGLVARLFELSRMETGRHSFSSEPVAIDELVTDTLSAFDAATLSNPVKVRVAMEDGLLVMGDHAALTQALTNLLTNAWKYTPEDEKRIALTAHQTGKWVDITVTDNGAGIRRAEQRHIFEKFERGRVAVDSGAHGAGLGLAIVRAIVRGHKGKIEVRSKPGEGSEFRIRLRGIHG